MRVFVADLGHNQLTLSSDVYPLGVANLATYAQAHFRGPEPSLTRYWTITYDLETWRSEGYMKHLGDYYYPEPWTFAAIVEAEPKALIQSRVASFGERPVGLGKFTRTMFAKNLRRTLVHASNYVEATQGVY